MTRISEANPGRRSVFVTNALEYVGPAAAKAMAGAGWNVFCHDRSFASPETRGRFERDNPGMLAAAAVEPEAFVADGLARFGRIDALVSNDIPEPASHPSAFAPPLEDEGDGLEGFEAYMESLAVAPVRLLRSALPAMKAAGSGSIVLVTSGAPLRVPCVSRAHGYIAGRAAAHGLVKALAPQLASRRIQINAVAPFLVYSQTFFPSASGADDPRYDALVKAAVPMGRFGKPAEIGTLIAMLAEGEAEFVTGQIIAFSGGGC